MKINQFVPDSKIFDVIGNDNNSNSTSSNGVSFSDFLKQKLDQVNNAQVQADNSTQSLVQGDNIDIHKVMLDTEQAKMSLELAVEIRNKFVEAYQQLNQTQL
jgi:flagellar hook-basal body complex protein FliE